MVKNRLPFFGTLPFLRMSSGLDAHHGVLRERGEVRYRPGRRGCCGRQGRGCAGGAIGSSAQVPAAVEQLPGDLKGDERLARAGGKREQDALLVRRRWLPAPARRRCPGSSGLDVAALVLEWHGGEAVAPGVRLGERHVPEFVRRGIARRLAFLAGLHVDAVDALAVGGIGVADRHLSGVVLGLRHAFGQFFVPCFSLDDGELGVAIDQNIIGGERLAAPPLAFEAARRDRGTRAGCGCPRRRPSPPLSARDQYVRLWFRLRS